MNIFEETFEHRGFIVRYKKVVGFWEASSMKQLDYEGKSIPINIKVTGSNEAEVIQKAKSEINRQLKNISK